MYGGIWGGLIPVLILMGGLVWISLAPVILNYQWKPGAKAFWVAGWVAIVVGLFLARTKTEYCRSIIRGLGDKNGIVIVTAWIFAGVFGKLMAGGGLVEGLLWFGMKTGAEGAIFTIIAFLLAMIFSSGTGTSMPVKTQANAVETIPAKCRTYNRARGPVLSRAECDIPTCPPEYGLPDNGEFLTGLPVAYLKFVVICTGPGFTSFGIQSIPDSMVETGTIVPSCDLAHQPTPGIIYREFNSTCCPHPVTYTGGTAGRIRIGPQQIIIRYVPQHSNRHGFM